MFFFPRFGSALVWLPWSSVSWCFGPLVLVLWSPGFSASLASWLLGFGGFLASVASWLLGFSGSWLQRVIFAEDLN